MFVTPIPNLVVIEIFVCDEPLLSNTSTTMTTHSTRPVQLFNPVNRRYGPPNPEMLRIQEIIFYSESRARAVLASILASNQAEVQWKKVRLVHELVSLSCLNATLYLLL